MLIFEFVSRNGILRKLYLSNEQLTIQDQIDDASLPCGKKVGSTAILNLWIVLGLLLNKNDFTAFNIVLKTNKLPNAKDSNARLTVRARPLDS